MGLRFLTTGEGCFQVFSRYTILVQHRVGRVLSFFSSRRNWNSTNPSPAGECAPPFSGGRGTLACGKGVGESQFRRGGHTQWYSLYSIYVLTYVTVIPLERDAARYSWVAYCHASYSMRDMKLLPTGEVCCHVFTIQLATQNNGKIVDMWCLVQTVLNII